MGMSCGAPKSDPDSKRIKLLLKGPSCSPSSGGSPFASSAPHLGPPKRCPSACVFWWFPSVCLGFGVCTWSFGLGAFSVGDVTASTKELTCTRGSSLEEQADMNDHLRERGRERERERQIEEERERERERER